MGTYIEITGDLVNLGLEGKFDFIGHGCNCQKIMGAGIASQIAERIPWAQQADKQDERLPIERLGDFTMSTIMNERTTMVINMYTQHMPGPDLSYSALTLILYKINLMYPGRSIGLPLIGCGLGGGDWETVKKIIRDQLCDMNVTIVRYNG